MKHLNLSINKLAQKFGADKKTVVVIFLGIAGVILLVLSELIPSGDSSKKETEQPELTAVSCSEYEKEVERRLEGILSQINGAGKVSVMVTLESTVESVYAQQGKQSADSKISENEYVIIKTDDGEGGILLKTTQPEIRGVAVVCSGGGSAVVRRDITDTVTAVLGISAARVNITAMKKDNGG